MVQFRGISINIVSQFDAKRLPEYSTARVFDATGTVVACYIPIYAGAQIWLEYSIDGPHPPQAAYFFKMSIDGQVVAKWDCTAKHEYQGKAVYLLQTVRSNVNNQSSILQKSMAFGSADRSRSPDVRNDCIEIRIHRIEYRRRIREVPLDPPLPKQLRGQETLRIKDHGLIEPFRPARRYQYQLLDPHDEPYATFRFCCRTQEYLERHQIIDADRPLSPTFLATSASHYFEADANTGTSPEEGSQPIVDPEEQGQPFTPAKSLTRDLSTDTENDSPITRKHGLSPRRSPVKPSSLHSERTPSIRDSIEDLPSTVTRSPQSPKRLTFLPKSSGDIPPSPTQHSSPLLPEALRIGIRIEKTRSPITDAKPSVSVSDSLTPPLEKISMKSSGQATATRQFPLRRSSIPTPTSIPTPPSTGSPRPIRLPYQRHKPSHLQLHPSPNTDLRLTPPLNTATTTLTAPINAPQIPSRTIATPPALSPFTQSGLLRRLSASSLNPKRPSRPSTPTPLIPTVQEVNAAMDGVYFEKLNNERKRESEGQGQKTNDEGGTTGSATSKTVRRICSAGLLNGLLGKKERRVVT